MRAHLYEYQEHFGTREECELPGKNKGGHFHGKFCIQFQIPGTEQADSDQCDPAGGLRHSGKWLENHHASPWLE